MVFVAVVCFAVAALTASALYDWYRDTHRPWTRRWDPRFMTYGSLAPERPTMTLLPGSLVVTYHSSGIWTV